jgi:hypothetical protein
MSFKTQRRSKPGTLQDPTQQGLLGRLRRDFCLGPGSVQDIHSKRLGVVICYQYFAMHPWQAVDNA